MSGAKLGQESINVNRCFYTNLLHKHFTFAADLKGVKLKLSRKLLFYNNMCAVLLFGK